MTQQSILIKQRCWNVGTVTKTERHSMKHTLLRDGPEKTFAVLLDQGDEPVSALLQFARDHKITAAHLTACGGFQRVTLGHFEPSAKEVQTNCNS